MKGVLALLAGSILVFGASVSIADTTTKTQMGKNWTCSTNASSSSLANDQAADKEMTKAKSAAAAYAFAAKHCRDCTKITCEYSESTSTTTNTDSSTKSNSSNSTEE